MMTLKEIFGFLEGFNVVSVTLRLVLSFLCGGAIGLGREKAHQVAGMRTHILVCLGSALVMLTGQYIYEVFGTGDPARLGAQVISGIGFLGAGCIIKSGYDMPRGVTTAAGLWGTACIGLSIGIGFFSAGIIVTVLVCLVMSVLKKIEYKVAHNNVWFGLLVELSGLETLTVICEKLSELGVKTGEVQIQEAKNKKNCQVVIPIRRKRKQTRKTILKHLEKTEGILKMKYIF